MMEQFQVFKLKMAEFLHRGERFISETLQTAWLDASLLTPRSVDIPLLMEVL